MHRLIGKTHSRLSLRSLALAALLWAAIVPHTLRAQDNVFTGTNTGAERIRIAAADFKPQTSDAQSSSLKSTFDATLFSDLSNAGLHPAVGNRCEHAGRFDAGRGIETRPDLEFSCA